MGARVSTVVSRKTNNDSRLVAGISTKPYVNVNSTKSRVINIFNTKNIGLSNSKVIPTRIEDFFSHECEEAPQADNEPAVAVLNGLGPANTFEHRLLLNYINNRDSPQLFIQFHKQSEQGRYANQTGLIDYEDIDELDFSNGGKKKQNGHAGNPPSAELLRQMNQGNSQQLAVNNLVAQVEEEEQWKVTKTIKGAVTQVAGGLMSVVNLITSTVAPNVEMQPAYLPQRRAQNNNRNYDDY